MRIVMGGAYSVSLGIFQGVLTSGFRGKQRVVYWLFGLHGSK